MSVTSLNLVHNIVAMYFLHNHETEIEIIWDEVPTMVEIAIF